MTYRTLLYGFISLALVLTYFQIQGKISLKNAGFEVGDVVDSLNGVYVYYNGSVNHVCGRNTGSGNYNLGLKYQCVEFVKRYYYQYLEHKMPDTYGHAKDFFDPGIKDGEWNKQRGLHQFTNPSSGKPKVDDLLIMDGTIYNPYGHVAIISKVENDQVELVQQNPGPAGRSRISLSMKKEGKLWKIEDSNTLGWLRMKRE